MGLTNLFGKGASHKTSKHVRMEISRITPSLFVGTNACCTVHYKLALIEKGILHDISLEGEAIDAPFGVESFLWLPTEDHAAPTQTALSLGVRHIDAILARKGKVYVHCKNGHGRAPTLVAAWFTAHGKNPDTAVRAVKKGRPETHLEPAQLRALRLFAKRVAGNGS